MPCVTWFCWPYILCFTFQASSHSFSLRSLVERTRSLPVGFPRHLPPRVAFVDLAPLTHHRGLPSTRRTQETIDLSHLWHKGRRHSTHSQTKRRRRSKGSRGSIYGPNPCPTPYVEAIEACSSRCQRRSKTQRRLSALTLLSVSDKSQLTTNDMKADFMTQMNVSQGVHP